MKILTGLATLVAILCLGHSAAALTINFDDLTPAVTFTFTGSNPIVSGPSQPSKYTIPIGSTGNFFAAYNNDNNTAISVSTISFGDTYNTFSVLWGSIDSYNTLDFLFGGNVVYTVTGSQAATQFGAAVNGNETITYATSGFNFDSVRLTTDSNAFEIDNINITAVPEPSVWATLGMGIAGTGFVVLRRRRSA